MTILLSPPKLRVELVESADASEVHFQGVLDCGSVSALQLQIDRISCGSCENVVLDLTDLDALDETGRAALEGLCHYVVFRGGIVTIADPSGHIGDLQLPLTPQMEAS